MSQLIDFNNLIRRFQRPIGVNSGQAQYFRCQECDAPDVRGSL